MITKHVLQQNVGTALPRTGVRHDREIVEFGIKGPKVTRFSENLSEDSGMSPRIKGPLAMPTQEAERIASTDQRPCVNHGLVTKPAPSYPMMKGDNYPPLAGGALPLQRRGPGRGQGRGQHAACIKSIAPKASHQPSSWIIVCQLHPCYRNSVLSDLLAGIGRSWSRSPLQNGDLGQKDHWFISSQPRMGW